MPARFIPVGEPAHDAERQALAFLVNGLPSSYTVYGNAWVVERGGVVYELDAVVVAPHAIYVVEVKSYRGRIEGTDHDWYIPEPIQSPVPLNRKTAQILNSQLRRESFSAGQVWVQSFVFLSATTQVGVRGPASRDRIYTRTSIVPAIQNEELALRLSGRKTLVPSESAENELLRLLTSSKDSRPVRRVREYELVEVLDHQDTFTEILGRNALSMAERVLRIYRIPPLATDAERERVGNRARWEAQVLGRIGKSQGILTADPPFTDEVGIVLPLEHFPGITLPTWLDRYGPASKGSTKADLRARTDLWIQVARTLSEAHQQGVVHRLLRPEVILVEDRPDPTQVRVTGFDLAKQLSIDATVSLTTVADERLVFAAPEVLNAFSSAEPASDQFSLGAILAVLLTGQSLFESTRALVAARRLLHRVRDLAQNIPLSLDEAVHKMVSMRPTDRFLTLDAAIKAVEEGRDPKSRVSPTLFVERRAPIDPDALEEGMRIGTDYEILSRLGQGGMAVVYAARHIVSGRTRALKIASANNSAEEALRGEYDTLSRLDHPNIVRVLDLSNMVEGRLTLVMERVGGENLRHWLAGHPNPDAQTQRSLAEDLLAGLDYLEQQPVTHKDIKPDNLLVGDNRLTIIDFSLAAMREDAPYGGTAMYRDPTSAKWTPGTDRYAAALCLFEIYAGRHAFDGRVPEPGQRPSVRPEDIEPAGLAAFFQKALDPSPEARFPTARAMRDALLVALGARVVAEMPTFADQEITVSTPLRLSGLPKRAINALMRCQLRTVGELLALSPDQIRAIHAIGTRTAADVVDFRNTLLSRGLEATSDPGRVDLPIFPELVDCPEPVSRLPLPAAIRTTLEDAKLPTVGSVARLTRSGLLAVPGIARGRFTQVVDALQSFTARTPDDEGPPTLDRMWSQASRPLTEDQCLAVERVVGVTGSPEIQGDIARDLGRSQPAISNDCSRGLEQLDKAALSEPLAALDSVLDGFGGIVRLDEIGRRVEEAWAPGIVTGAGIVRLLTRLAQGRIHILEMEEIEQPLVARPAFDRATLKAFAGEVMRIASQWPPVEPESARRNLAALLPDYPRDPLSLGVRLCADVEMAEGGHLFVPPVDAPQSIAFVLDRTRDPMTLDALRDRVLATFGPDTPWPDADHLLALLSDLDCRLEGNRVIPGRTRSVMAPVGLTPDAPTVGVGSRSPEMVVRDMLAAAAGVRGFRMLVTPPERHAEIGRSVAKALGFTWLSFENEFFEDHRDDIAALERAERFAAQRSALEDAARETMSRLLEEYGAPGRKIVLGDTGLWGTCDALDLPRLIYDETLSGTLGFWVIVVPGVIHKEQPRFNEGPSTWHLKGATVALLEALP